MRQIDSVETLSLAVPSHTVEDHVYMVTMTAQCSCPGYMYHRKCKHIVQVLNTLEQLLDNEEAS